MVESIYNGTSDLHFCYNGTLGGQSYELNRQWLNHDWPLPPPLPPLSLDSCSVTKIPPVTDLLQHLPGTDNDGSLGRMAQGAQSKSKFASLVNRIAKGSIMYGKEISAEKIKLMAKIQVSGQELETINQFKYLIAIIREEEPKLEVFARLTQTSATLARLKPIVKVKTSP
ncbi:hypothetical protein ElyMa_006658700 [Elysia marginata]|uniref:Uncharacterized protein n=1 Tax=Elysia marginata TaxID=1093978 RepID=A0AAV4IQY9_9GAST|nr:hypothetical protein ElyMa_006658700 [Elysia marginata]